MTSFTSRARRLGIFSGAALLAFALSAPAAFAAETPGSINAQSSEPAYKNTALPFEGRAEENYGEDPVLTGALGGQFVSGLQGDDEKYLKTAATPKHYLANNSETNRHNGSSTLTEAELREYYTPAFAQLVGEFGAGSLMTSYNAVNGVPVSASREYVETLARCTFGFNGTVTSDCDAIRDVWQPANHNWGPDGTPLSAPKPSPGP